MTYTWRQFKQLRASYGREFDKVMGDFSDKAIAVGRPKKGQRRVDGEGCIVIAEHDFTCGPPALILPPKRIVTRTRAIFEQIEDDPRALNSGEFGMYPDGHDWLGVAHSPHGTSHITSPYLVMSRRVETFEIEVDE